METKICTVCGAEKALKDFEKKYDRPGSDRRRGQCRRCRYLRKRGPLKPRPEPMTRSEIRKKNIYAWKHLAGGRCTKCGYDKYFGALEFHHRDPATKEMHVSRFLKKVHPRGVSQTGDKIRAELAKCDLVCANCHREIHFNLRLIS